MNFFPTAGELASRIDWTAILSNPTLQMILLVVAGMVIYRIVSLGVKFTVILIVGILAILFVKYVVPWSAIIAITAAVIEYVFQPFYLGRSWECTVKGVLSVAASLAVLAAQNSFILAMMVYFFRNKEMDSIKAAGILASALTVGLFVAGCLL